MVLNECIKLSNGVEIPKIGFGTWEIENTKTAEAVREALSVGYRHIDTAEAYGNEQGVGEGIRASGLSRSEIFVTTKVAAEIKNYNDAVRAIDSSIRLLGFDYVDLMLIHCPQPWSDFRGGDYFEENRAVWRALERAYEAGKVRAIGISNFEEKDVENILSDCKIAPMVNQIQVHIGNTPTELIDYCKSKNIVVEGYSPAAHGRVFGNEQIGKVAEKYGVSVAQLCNRYVLQLGAITLPKTTSAERMEENAALDFEISPEDMNYLESITGIE